ncbi:MAG TPA: L,D-transpeptidase family protein, partial [Gemmatimonadota bacterium]|nr:L,D-transpeptidase family protein [Gemmatimonadota bacterium]
PYAARAAYGRGPAPSPSGEGPVQEKLRERIEAAGEPARLSVDGTEIEATSSLPLFYERRAYRPAWTDAHGALPALDSLVAAIGRADGQGLDPADYHLDAIRVAAREARRPGPVAADAGRLVDLELLATDAYLLLAGHYLTGKVDPVSIDPKWQGTPRERDLPAVLEAALAGDSVSASLADLLPPRPAYARLVDALARYRAIAAGGGWPVLGEGPALRRGDRGDRVATLRRRLEATGDLPSDSAARAASAAVQADSFGSDVAGAVARYQARNGLEPDSVVGAATVRELSVPAADRVRRIRANLERARWLPQDLGRRHVVVNAADFRVHLVDDGRATLSSRAIVGRPYRKTPVFSDRIRYVVFNPAWEVPPYLAVEDELPLIREDPGFLERVGMKVVRGWGASADTVDPSTVDWKALGPEHFPYRLRQDPGPLNALGRVKIMFPNPFNVYMHDTPDRGLFARNTRTFSSGCIRVQRAMDLAAALLSSDDPAWTRARVDSVVATGEERTVPLRTPVPVHVLYFTAWAEDDGTVEFRPDVYDRDPRLEAALDERAAPADSAGEGVR